MKQQKITKNQSKKSVKVIDERSPKIPETTVVGVDLPVRTVFYVEIGDMEPLRVQLLVQEINRVYQGAKGGVHYIVPVRHGKLKTDIQFEHELLDMIRSICEVSNDGQIVFKDGHQEVVIMREKI